MKSKWLSEEQKYDGAQLRSLFAYLNYEMVGDSILGWVGPCDIPLDKMVDGEDALVNAEIRGSKMLHFIVELFHEPLGSAITFQRLMACLCQEAIKEAGHDVLREGDDLYFNGGKLSISIAAKSPMSSMIHFALNISNEGTPVKTCSLEDLGIQPEEFAKNLMEKVVKERAGIEFAKVKVKPLN